MKERILESGPHSCSYAILGISQAASNECLIASASKRLDAQYK